MTLYTYITPNIIEYYGESLADLAKMPTTTKLGEAPYERALAPEGARAKILSIDGLKTYMLRSTGWIEIAQNTGTSTGVVINPDDIMEGLTSGNSYDFIDSLFG